MFFDGSVSVVYSVHGTTASRDVTSIVEEGIHHILIGGTNSMSDQAPPRTVPTLGDGGLAGVCSGS